MTQAKQDMIELGRTELERWLRDLLGNIRGVILASSLKEYGPGKQVTLFTLQDLLRLWKSDRAKKEGDRGMLKALRKAGYRQAYQGKQLRLKSGQQVRLWVVAAPEDAGRWLAMTKPNELADEYERQRVIVSQRPNKL